MSTKEQRSEWTRRHRAKNPAKWKAIHRAYYEKIKAKHKSRSRIWALKNPSRVKAIYARWKKSNPKSFRRIRNKSVKKRRASDVEFKLRCNLSSRIAGVIRRINATKSKRTIKLIGCTVQFLMGHLEARFKPGMTWKNYGKVWHVDHKLPCASFNLSDPNQQSICFNYQNLQPLFAKDNILKGARIVKN